MFVGNHYTLSEEDDAKKVLEAAHQHFDGKIVLKYFNRLPRFENGKIDRPTLTKDTIRS